MTNFTYDDTVPTTGANPSNQYTLMTQNFASIKAILAVDHVTLSTNDGGQHLQVSYNGNHTPAAPMGTNSVLYTSIGSASASSRLNFVNPNATYPVNTMAAFGVFPGSNVNGAIAALGNQTFNVSTVVKSQPAGVNTYTVTLQANAVTGQNFGVLCNVNTSASANATMCIDYNIIGNGVFVLLFRNPTTALPLDPTFFTFTVYQI